MNTLLISYFTTQNFLFLTICYPNYSCSWLNSLTVVAILQGIKGKHRNCRANCCIMKALELQQVENCCCSV